MDESIRAIRAGKKRRAQQYAEHAHEQVRRELERIGELEPASAVASAERLVAESVKLLAAMKTLETLYDTEES
jgi:hypothetical protein